MSRNITDVARGQVSGRELIQPSAYLMQDRYLAGSTLPTMTGYQSGNFIGGRRLRQSNTNFDINGLSQPAGLIPNTKSHSYVSNIAGLTPSYGGTLTTGLKADLSQPIEYTSRYNQMGFTDPRQLGILNEGLYGTPNASRNSEIGRLERSAGRYTSLLHGVQELGGNVR
jgi:hypothetical protein